MTIAEQMIPELKSEAVMTRKLLARVPQDKLSFTPGHGVHTIGWNASHLTDIVGWVPMIVNEPGLDLATMDPKEREAGIARSKDIAAALKQFDDNLAKSIAALQGVSDATMAQTWTMRAGPQEILTMKKGDCLRKWIFTHTAHHRAVLSTLLRLAGVEHGSIYEE